MSNIIKFKRSAVAGKIPTVASLSEGEPCYNIVDGYIYMEKTVNGVSSIIRFSPDNQNTGYGTNFFLFNNSYDDDGRSSIFVPPCPVNLIQMYAVTKVIKQYSASTCNLYKNGTILLGSVTIPANTALSNRLTFLTPPNIGITDILSIDYDGDWNSGICTYITW